ncbi:MAG: hypothetical protein GEU28_03110 [Dehalococcoidia bacterium]|nr:hypothetical protein [Dehalococcoidia bacterium]
MGAGIDLALRPAVVVGAGGAARAVLQALTEADIRSILVLNRSADRARTLAVRFGVGCDTLEAAPPSVFRTARLVVNATSIGMLHGEQGLPFDPRQLSPGCFVADLVANPPRTAFLEAAEESGCFVLGGLPMLVHQGAEAFQLWTGREAPLDVMMTAAEKATTLAEGNER